MQERSGKSSSQGTAEGDAQVDSSGLGQARGSDRGPDGDALKGKPEARKGTGTVQDEDEPGGGVDTGGSGPKSGTPTAGSIAGA
jgi:hypothetical protein